MTAIIIILTLALIPALLSLILIRKAKQRFRSRMRIIRLSNLSYRRSLPSQVSRPTLEFSQFHQEHLGDLTCQYNARSPYLRCAVNPSGPCEGCSYYKSRSN